VSESDVLKGRKYRKYFWEVFDTVVWVKVRSGYLVDQCLSQILIFGQTLIRGGKRDVYIVEFVI